MPRESVSLFLNISSSASLVYAVPSLRLNSARSLSQKQPYPPAAEFMAKSSSKIMKSGFAILEKAAISEANLDAKLSHSGQLANGCEVPSVFYNWCEISAAA